MESLLDRIDSCPDLPTIPAVALKIVSLCRESDADLDQLARLISLDPGMVLRVLRTANSCLFPRSPKVTSVKRATVRLGLKMTRMSVLSFSLLASTLKDAPAAFDLQCFWKHALVTANTARAKRAPAKKALAPGKKALAPGKKAPAARRVSCQRRPKVASPARTSQPRMTAL